MAKQIYIPTMEELYMIQDMDINIYNYLLAKVIELITLEGITYYNKGILKNEFKYFRENPEIAYAICKMYPEELPYSEIAQCDIGLCLDLISEEKDNSIYQLDNLVSFQENTTNNIYIIKTVIEILAKKLQTNPKYRFEYKANSFGFEYRENSLLDSIFSTEFINSLSYSPRMLEQLSRIEPAYILKDGSSISDKKDMLNKAMNYYIARYHLAQNKGASSQYNGKDILTAPDQNVKRLVRYIDKRRDRKY